MLYAELKVTEVVGAAFKLRLPSAAAFPLSFPFVRLRFFFFFVPTSMVPNESRLMISAAMPTPPEAPASPSAGVSASSSGVVVPELTSGIGRAGSHSHPNKTSVWA